MPALDLLFRPFPFGATTLRNRIVMAPMTRNFSPGGVPMTCGRLLLHLCTHLAFHLGQAGYLRRVVTGDTRSSGPVSVRELAET